MRKNASEEGREDLDGEDANDAEATVYDDGKTGGSSASSSIAAAGDAPSNEISEEDAEVLLCPLLQFSDIDTVGELSKLEREQRTALHKRLNHEKDVILKRIDETIKAFDEYHYDMRNEKMKLDADLTTARIRALTLLDELVLLKNFEKRDNELAAKLEKCRTDKAQVVADIADCQEKLTKKKEDIELWQVSQIHAYIFPSLYLPT